MAYRVIVIGAGVGGLAAALALRQAGAEVEVFERYDDPARDAGTFVSIAANGMRMLRRLGCSDQVLARGFLCPAMNVYSGSGKRLATMPFAGSEYASPAGLTIKRGALISVLAGQAAARGARIRTGARFTGATATRGQVTACFSGGAEARGDLLIGADGVRSAVRSVIDPSAPAPRYTGLVGFGGYADTDVGIRPGEFNMVFGKRVFFGYTRHPDDGPWWFANVPWPRQPSSAGLAAVSSSEWKTRLQHLVAGDRTPAGELIAATSHPLRPAVSYVMPPVPVWSRERMLLIGDAAHCASSSSGQGASLALEDAVTLARSLHHAADVPAALAMYERERRARVQRVVRHGARGSRSKTFGPVGRALSEALMPFIFRQLAKRNSLRWLYDYDIDWQPPGPPGTGASLG